MTDQSKHPSYGDIFLKCDRKWQLFIKFTVIFPSYSFSHIFMFYSYYIIKKGMLERICLHPIVKCPWTYSVHTYQYTCVLSVRMFRCGIFSPQIFTMCVHMVNICPWFWIKMLTNFYKAIFRVFFYFKQISLLSVDLSALYLYFT